jgi:NADP-dependent 3-hydroxy acid dehydrogenase YdfG
MTDPYELLAGQTAIVTGASSGIGRELARMLLDAGVRVALVGRDAARLRPIADAADPGSTLSIACDVRDDASVRAMAAEVEQSWGRIDILINSAGLFRVASLPETTNEMWDDLWRTNVNGTFYATRAVLPGMLERSRGTIVVVASVASYRGFANTAAYAATKAAVTGFARALTTEVRRKGVRVVNVIAGPVDTPLWEGMDKPLEREEMLTPPEVARAVMSAITVSPTQVMEEILLLPQRGIYY